MILTVSPTVSVIKMHFAQKNQSCCQKNPCKKEIPSGCDKEKCVLNLNFNISQFIVSKLKYDFIRNSFEVVKQKIISFDKRLISNYSYSIWQPPEIDA
jgi:hypothetical protein